MMAKMELNWYIWLAGLCLVLIVLFFSLMKKKKIFKKLKSVIPFLFLVFLLGLIAALLRYFDGSLFEHPREPLITVLEAVILFSVLILLVKMVSFFVFDFLMGIKQNIKYPRLIKDVAVIVLYIIGISMIAKFHFNTDLNVVLASSAVVTVVIGFALQDILGDLFAGLVLNMEESIGIGDWIRAGDIEGKIEQLRWRSIKIRTIDNTLVLIPNRIASKEEVIRFGRSTEAFALRLQIGVSYKCSPDFVISVILRVVDSVSPILKKPAPAVMVKSYDDFAVVYEIKFWLNDYSVKDPVKSEIRRKCWYAFKRNDIQIPFPIRDIYIKDFKKEPTVEVPVSHLLDIFKKNEIFAPIGDKELAALAEDIQIVSYGRGEVLIREGEVGRYFYHILEGEAEVVIDNKVIAHLKADDCAGEMSLFTGEKTVAEVRVAVESKVLRISSEKFRETVKINDRVARKVSEVIARRKGELSEAGKKQDTMNTSAIKKVSENIFLRIKNYFSF
jgi:small-conductance mechanosensitive channel